MSLSHHCLIVDHFLHHVEHKSNPHLPFVAFFVRTSAIISFNIMSSSCCCTFVEADGTSCHVNCTVTRAELLDKDNKPVLCEGENFEICKKCKHPVSDHIDKEPAQTQAGKYRFPMMYDVLRKNEQILL